MADYGLPLLRKGMEPDEEEGKDMKSKHILTIYLPPECRYLVNPIATTSIDVYRCVIAGLLWQLSGYESAEYNYLFVCVLYSYAIILFEIATRADLYSVS